MVKLLSKSWRTRDIHKKTDGTVEHPQDQVKQVWRHENASVPGCVPEVSNQSPCQAQGDVRSRRDDVDAWDNDEHFHQRFLSSTFVAAAGVLPPRDCPVQLNHRDGGCYSNNAKRGERDDDH